MDTKVKDESVSFSTVADYAAAIQRVGAGQFISKYRETGQRFFASTYGAPFFALSRFAPEVIASPEKNLVVISPDPSLAADGGRWLSLYAKIHTSRRFSLTLCFPYKPLGGKAPKPLLFQPPQQVVKNWRKHLEALSTPPDVVIFYPENFAELESAASEFILRAAGCKILVSCFTRMDSLIARRLLALHGYANSDIVGFDIADSEPQHFASGAWWFSAVVPDEEKKQSPDVALIEELRTAHRQLVRNFRQVDTREGRADIAAAVATRATDSVDGTDVQAIRLSPVEGIDLASGRFFKVNDATEGAGFTWDDTVMSADLLALQPPVDLDIAEDEDRLAVWCWISHALAQDAERELKKMTADEASAPTPESAGAEAKSSASVETDESNSELVAAPEAMPIVEGAEHIAVESAIVPTEAEQVADANVEPVTSAPRSSLRGRSRLSRSAGTVNVLALAARLGKEGTDAETSFDTAKAKILDWLRSKNFVIADANTNSHVELPDGEVTIETDGEAIWSMRFDDRRSMEDGAIWRVEATLLGQPAPAISLRLIQVRSSEDAPPPVASGVPQVVSGIATHVGLQDAGEQLRNTAVKLKRESDSLWLGRLLLNPHRTQPVIVISGEVDSSANRLAKRLAGVAHVVSINDGIVNQMIRVFGRERAVFGNAVRLYRPGFTADANPYQHPTWALKGTQLPKWLANDVFEEACAISLEAGDLDDRAPSFQSVRNLLAAKRMAMSEQRISELRKQAESVESSKNEKIHQLQEMRDEQDAMLAIYREENDKLTRQVEQFKRDLQAALLERDTAAEEVRQLNYRLNNQWADEAGNDSAQNEETYYPDSWDDLEDWVELYGENKLVLHEKAIKAARSSPFKDIPLAYKAMEWLVKHYIPMRTRSADDNETRERCQQALDALGLEESDVGTAKNIKRYKQEYKRQYEGRQITLDRHLKSGVGFGGDYQFRLYFHYDDDANKVVVGHMPTHLTNRLTHQG